MATVFIPAQLRELTGGERKVEIEGGTVREIVDRLEAQWPGLEARLCNGDAIAPGLVVSIDETVTSQGLRAKVAAESEVHFLPAIGGG